MDQINLLSKNSLNTIWQTTIKELITIYKMQSNAQSLQCQIDQITNNSLLFIENNINSNETNIENLQRTRELLSLLTKIQSSNHEECTAHLKEVLLLLRNLLINLNKAINKLDFLSSHDTLTELSNRRYFNDIFSYELNRAEKHKTNIFIFSIDLDNFKGINDQFGHPSGDIALKEFAKILRSNVRKGDIVCRLGGDEFIIMLTDIDLSQAKKIAYSIQKTARETPLKMSGEAIVHLSLSIGIAQYPNDATSCHELLSNADKALYFSKQNGKNTVSASCEINEIPIKNYPSDPHSVINIHQSISLGHIVPFFQPIFHSGSESIIAYEILARLNDQVNPILPANQFLDMIKNQGLIDDFQRALLRKTFNVLNENTELINSDILLFINIYPRDIIDEQFISYLKSLSTHFNINERRIVFEISEDHPICDVHLTKNRMNKLRKIGYRFALDDFGKGFNSIKYLNDLYFDFIKIDGSLIKRVSICNNTNIIIENIINLCHDLDMKIICECVESQDVLNNLKTIGADYVQGYFLGIPSPLPSQQINKPEIV